MHVLFCPSTQTVDCDKDRPPLRGKGSELSPGVLLTSWWLETPAVFGRLSFPFNEDWRGGVAHLSGPLPACDILLTPFDSTCCVDSVLSRKNLE